MEKLTRYDITNEKLRVCHRACGWTLIQEYENFNLWQRNSGIRECFYKNQVPNLNSNALKTDDPDAIAKKITSSTNILNQTDFKDYDDVMEYLKNDKRQTG